MGSDLDRASGSGNPTAFVMCLQLRYLGQHLCKINITRGGPFLFRGQQLIWNRPPSTSFHTYRNGMDRSGSYRIGTRNMIAGTDPHPHHHPHPRGYSSAFRGESCGWAVARLTLVFAACSASCSPCCLFMRIGRDQFIKHLENTWNEF